MEMKLFRRIAEGLRLPSKFPLAGMEISQRWLGWVRLARRKGGYLLADYALEELSPEGVRASLLSSNVVIPPEVEQKVASILNRSRAKIKKLSILLPDNVVKVVILDNLQRLPHREGETLKLIQWKLKKTLPFRIEEATIGFQPMVSRDGSPKLLVAIVKRGVREHFEKLFAPLGVVPGLVIPSSFGLVNFCHWSMPRGIGDTSEKMLINFAERYISIMIFRGEKLIFFRTKDLGAGLPVSSGFQIPLRELYSSYIYYKEHLGGNGLKMVYVGGISPRLTELQSQITENFDFRVENINPWGTIKLDEGVSMDKVGIQRLTSTMGLIVGS